MSWSEHSLRTITLNWNTILNTKAEMLYLSMCIICVTHLELWFSSWEMSSTMSFSEASCAMALQSLQATKALAMASSPCCQKNRAIFCRFISTAHTISSWKGKGKWLISGSSKSMSTSSSRLRVVFWRPLRIGMSSWWRSVTSEWGWKTQAAMKRLIRWFSNDIHCQTFSRKGQP